MPMRRKRGRPCRARSSRRGAATVEAAVVAPFLVALILGTIDVGQYVVVAQTVSNASREAARVAARHSTASVSDVENAASAYLADIYPGTSVQVNVTDASGNAIPAGDLTTIPTGSAITVQVMFPFDTLRWVDVVPLLNNKSLETTTTMRRE